MPAVRDRPDEVGPASVSATSTVATFQRGFCVFLFGRNLPSEDGAIYSQPPAGGVTAFTQDYSRQVGVELNYSFE